MSALQHVPQSVALQAHATRLAVQYDTFQLTVESDMTHQRCLMKLTAQKCCHRNVVRMWPTDVDGWMRIVQVYTQCAKIQGMYTMQ